MPAPTDEFRGQTDLSSQGEAWVAVTPSANPFAVLPRAIWVDVAGDITMEGRDGVSATFTVPAGLLPMRPYRITAATATGIKAIF